MGESRTIVEAANVMSRSIKNFQQVMQKLTPAFENANRIFGDFNKMLARIDRQMYLARLRRWVPIWIFVLVLAIVLSWWLT